MPIHIEDLFSFWAPTQKQALKAATIFLVAATTLGSAFERAYAAQAGDSCNATNPTPPPTVVPGTICSLNSNPSNTACFPNTNLPSSNWTCVASFINDKINSLLQKYKISRAVFDNDWTQEEWAEVYSLKRSLQIEQLLLAKGVAPETVNAMMQLAFEKKGEASPGFFATPPGRRLGMSVAPATYFQLNGSIGAAYTKNSGLALTDSSASLAPGSKTAAYTENSAGGTIGFTYDASGFLPANQKLTLKANFGYGDSARKFGDAPDLNILGLNIASIKKDTYTFAGSARWDNGPMYVGGAYAYNFGRGHLTNYVDGSTGNYNSSGNALDFRIGRSFAIERPITDTSLKGASATQSPMWVPAVSILDLSARIGYRNDIANGFTDSSGFTYGDEKTTFGIFGGRAQLNTFIASPGWMWIPNIAFTLDQRFGYSQTLTIPVQSAVPTGTNVSFGQGSTIWGVEAGVAFLRTRNEWSGSLQGFYNASSNTNNLGGRLRISLPLWAGEPVIRK